MIKLKNIKQKVLTDDNFAIAVEYMLSKVILENPVGQLKFIYKKYKIVKNLKNKFSIYDNKSNKKLYDGIYLQDVAKYIVNNIKNQSKISYILFLEKELFNQKHKINFFEKKLFQHPNENIEIKLNSMYQYYDLYKNSLISCLKNDIQWS